MSELLFTKADVWEHGNYEISIEIEESNQVLKKVLIALWADPTLQGVFLNHNVEPNKQQKFDVSKLQDSKISDLYGIAKLPNNHEVACMTNAYHIEGEANWISFGILVGALGQYYKIGSFPEDDGTPLTWQEPIINWYCDICKRIYTKAPFRCAYIGGTEAVDFLSTEFETHGIPKERHVGILYSNKNKLEWYPKTNNTFV
jgi:hypothetical protein